MIFHGAEQRFRGTFCLVPANARQQRDPLDQLVYNGAPPGLAFLGSL
jgi:hypothetical protein